MFLPLTTDPDSDTKKNDGASMGAGGSKNNANDVATIRRHVEWMCWMTFVNFALTLFAVVAVALALYDGRGKMKVYMDAADLTPTKVGAMSENAQNIMSNVRSISANMVPVSEVTANSVVNATGGTSNVSFAEAATAALVGVGHADWNAVLGNGSLVMGSVAKMNFSVVTSLFEQAREPETQSVIKRQVDKALATFDYATRGVANVVAVFRDGVVAEEKDRTAS